VEATVEHPFFVFNQGWSSYCPDSTLRRYGLLCQPLLVGDRCISITQRSFPLPSTTSPPQEKNLIEPRDVSRGCDLAAQPSSVSRTSCKAPAPLSSSIAQHVNNVRQVHSVTTFDHKLYDVIQFDNKLRVVNQSNNLQLKSPFISSVSHAHDCTNTLLNKHALTFAQSNIKNASDFPSSENPTSTVVRVSSTSPSLSVPLSLTHVMRPELSGAHLGTRLGSRKRRSSAPPCITATVEGTESSITHEIGRLKSCSNKLGQGNVAFAQHGEVISVSTVPPFCGGAKREYVRCCNSPAKHKRSRNS